MAEPCALRTGELEQRDEVAVGVEHPEFTSAPRRIPYRSIGVNDSDRIAVRVQRFDPRDLYPASASSRSPSAGRPAWRMPGPPHPV